MNAVNGYTGIMLVPIHIDFSQLVTIILTSTLALLMSVLWFPVVILLLYGNRSIATRTVRIRFEMEKNNS